MRGWPGLSLPPALGLVPLLALTAVLLASWPL
jgi:hypothetical protein